MFAHFNPPPRTGSKCSIYRDRVSGGGAHSGYAATGASLERLDVSYADTAVADCVRNVVQDKLNRSWVIVRLTTPPVVLADASVQGEHSAVPTSIDDLRLERLADGKHVRCAGVTAGGPVNHHLSVCECQ